MKRESYLDETYINIAAFFALLMPTITLYVGFFSILNAAYQTDTIVRSLPVLLVTLVGAQITQVVAYLGHIYILRMRLGASERHLRGAILERMES